MATRSHVEDVHIVWIAAGLGCDGDTVSIAAATQPNIENVLPGAIPGLHDVHLHNPVFAFEPGSNSFMMWWYKAEQGELDPFVLVVENPPGGTKAGNMVTRRGHRRTATL